MSGVSALGNNNATDASEQDIELQEVSSFGKITDGTSQVNSSSSSLSSIFENLSEISAQQLQREREREAGQLEGAVDDEGQESHNLLTDRFQILRSSHANKKKCAVVFVIIFVGWLVALISYSQGTKAVSKPTEDVTPSPILSSSAPTKTSSAVSTTTAAKSPSKKQITLTDYRMANFYVFKAPYNFAGTVNYIMRGGSNYLLKSIKDKSATKLFESTTFDYNGNTYSVSDIDMSPTLDRILVKTNKETQWRHSSFAYYWMYDIAAKTFDPLINEDAFISSAQWSPKGNFVSMVFENNIYLLNVTSGAVDQLTDDGSADIFNGKPDWAYEEEVLSSDNSIWWSPDESNMLYMRLDDTSVPIYPLEFFVHKAEGKYPEIEELRYPKPGFSNPEPTLVNYNIAKKQKSAVPDSDFGPEFIVYMAQFITATEVIYKESDREAQMLNVNLYNVETGEKTKLRQVRASDYKGWIEKPGPFVICRRNESLGYLDTVVSKDYDRLAYFASYRDMEPSAILTEGDYNVGTKYAYNQDEDAVYFLASKSGDPLSMYLYKTSIGTLEKTALTPDAERAFYDIDFNVDASVAVLDYQGPDVSFQKMVELSKFDAEYYAKQPLLVNNAIAKASQAVFAVPTTTYGQLTMDGIQFEYIEIKPANFDPGRAQAYPLLVNIYGGPGSTKLSSAYSVGFEHVVSSSLDAVVFYLDPRGTGGKSWEFRSYANRKIGYWEPRDITNLTKTLMSERSYIDPDRTAIWGWSYGGFTTLKTLEYDQGDVFKYGMAVAPVTDWAFYDSIYTERFMDTPDNNADGYAESRVNHVKNFKKVHRFLIMHGTADDNVHFQNTLKLLDEFDINGVENYDMHVFPDSDHSIYYNNANTIVYDKLFKWLQKAFANEF